MPIFPPSPNNVAFGFIPMDGVPLYYGDGAVREYLNQHPVAINIYTDSDGVLHFDSQTPPPVPSSLSQKRVAVAPTSMGLNATESPVMTILT